MIAALDEAERHVIAADRPIDGERMLPRHFLIFLPAEDANRAGAVHAAGKNEMTPAVLDEKACDDLLAAVA